MQLIRPGRGEKDLLIISSEGLVVHVEEKYIAVIGMACDGKILGYTRIGSRFIVVVGSRQSEIILTNVSGLTIEKRGKHHTLPHLLSSYGVAKV